MNAIQTSAVKIAQSDIVRDTANGRIVSSIDAICKAQAATLEWTIPHSAIAGTTFLSLALGPNLERETSPQIGEIDRASSSETWDFQDVDDADAKVCLRSWLDD